MMQMTRQKHILTCFRALWVPATWWISFILLPVMAHAQGISASASSDTTTILIGQQFNLKLELTHPRNQSISWIDIPDTLGKLEIVSKSKIDTLPGDGALLTRRQILTFTCFDTGYYVIPPFLFAYRQSPDTTTLLAETRPLLVTVNTIPVDTTKAIRDIKGPVEVPWTLSDFLPYIGAVILAALLIWLILYLRRKFKKEKIIAAPVIPSRPAHEIALEELKKLEAEKIWQQGDFKQYHTRLTDIIRAYIENRWQLPAMEQTTDEILDSFTTGMLPVELYEKMRLMLQTADLVKFAKLQPVAYENEQSMAFAYEMVTLTAKTPMSAQEAREAAP